MNTNIKRSLSGKLLLWLLVAPVFSGAAMASPIFFETTDLVDITPGEDRWRYDYTVGNDTRFDIEQFTIYFDYGLYEFSLISDDFGYVVDPDTFSAPSDWDPFVAPTDLILGEVQDGFYDAFALFDLIAPGDPISGFSVDFTFLGDGTPGEQFFEFFGFDEFGDDVLGESYTQRMMTEPPVAVPAPATGTLLVLGTLALFSRRKLSSR